MNKKNTLVFGLVSVILFFGLSSFMNGYPGGSPGGYTGSPGDGHNCTSCHNGSASNVTGWITSNVPSEGYTPGTAYTITVTVSGSGSKGFEVSPQNLAGGLLGSLTAGSGTKLVHSNSAVTHSNSSNTNPKVWTFTWTAPAVNTGSVTFYGAFTVNKPVTKLSTMVVPEKSSVLIAAAGFDQELCANTTQLQGNNPSPQTGIWSIVSGYVVFDNINIYNTHIDSVAEGENVLCWTIGSSSDTVKIINNSFTVNAGEDMTTSDGAVSLSATEPQAGGSGLWTIIEGDGTFGDNTLFNTDVTGITMNHNVYQWTVTQNSCTSSDTMVVTNTLGIGGHVNSNLNFSIYPNPGNGLFHIYSKTGWEHGSEFNVFTLGGQMVFKQIVTDENTRIDLTNLKKGFYYVTLKLGDQKAGMKMVLN